MTVVGGPYAFLGPMVGALSYEYLRWFISQFELLEKYWQFSFGFLLLVVVLFFDNGVYGGLERFRAWLGVARQRYEADGVSGVAALVAETVAGWARSLNELLRKQYRGLLARIRALG